MQIAAACLGLKQIKVNITCRSKKTPFEEHPLCMECLLESNDASLAIFECSADIFDLVYSISLIVPDSDLEFIER